MEIARLTPYQYGVLCQAAGGPAPILLVPRPNRRDDPSLRSTLQGRHAEVKQLVEQNLVEDVTRDFAEPVAEHAIKAGRKFAVYGLTEVGYLLFKDCDERAIN